MLFYLTFCFVLPQTRKHNEKRKKHITLFLILIFFRNFAHKLYRIHNKMQLHKLNIVLCGTGTVGGTLLQQIADQQQYLKTKMNTDLQVVGVVDIFNILVNSNGLDMSQYAEGGAFSMDKFREAFKQAPTSSVELIREAVLNLGVSNMVFVDCTASYDIAALYQDFLDKSISIVCANKIAASGDLNAYLKLKETALKNDCKYHFETNVGAGLPIIRTIDELRASGDKIVKLEAVLSGTLNFVFNTISADIPFSKAVQMAKEARFSEPDPRIDLAGLDVIRKLVILARESGYMLSQDDIEKNLFVPQSFFDGSLDDFWAHLPELDAQFEALRQEVEANGQHLRFVAKLENGKGSVSLQKVDSTHPAYNLEGSNNIVLLHTERYNPHPMIIIGYGAGAGVTAAGVFADIISIAGAH